MRQAFSLFLGLVTAVGLSSGATYTTLSSWQAAMTSSTNVDFNALPVGAISPTLTVGTAPDQAVFSGYGAAAVGEFAYVNNSTCCAPTGSGAYLSTDLTGTPHGLQVTFANGTTTAFGLNIWSFGPTQLGTTVTVKIYDASNLTTPSSTTPLTTNPHAWTPASYTALFFGYTGANAVGKVEFEVSTSNDKVALDNFAWGLAKLNDPEPPPSSETPEVPTLGYVGIGFLAVFLSRARRNVSQ